MGKFFQYIKEPWRIVVAFDRHIASIVPDKLFIKCQYRCNLGKKLDLKNPQTYNEKLQWFKLYDRNPLYTTLVDKYAVKYHVAKIIGEEHIIPTLGVYSKFDKIDFDKLPDKFVLKCTHSSGDIVICKDKKNFDIESAGKKLTKCLKKNFYKNSREWPYKNVPRKLMAEKYLADKNGELNDYKFYCFNGKVSTCMVCEGRFSSSGVRYHYFDPQWKYLPYCVYENVNIDNLQKLKPNSLDKMIDIAERLSSGIPQVRVDLYEVDGKVYFGEMTFFSAGGFDNDISEHADLELGKEFILPNSN